MGAAQPARIKKDTEAPSEGVLTLTRKEAAKALNIGESLLDRLTDAGKIAFCRVGRRKLYRPQALADYLAKTEKKTRAA